MKLETLHKSKVLNSMVTKFFRNFCGLSILIPVKVGTCQFLGQSFGPRTANASILMKFCTLNKSRVANSMVTIAFCDLWRLSNLALLNIGTCHLLGRTFKQELQELQFGEILHSVQVKDAEFNGGNSFVILDTCQFWSLSVLAPVLF